MRGKPISWASLQRIEAGQPRIPRDGVVDLRVADDLVKRAPLDLLEQAWTDASRVQAARAPRRDFDARG